MPTGETPTQTAARILTNALNPFFVFTALYTAVAFSETGPLAAAGYLLLELLAAGAVAGFVWLRQRRRKVSDFWISARAERLVPAIFMLLISVALIVALVLTNAPENLFRTALSMLLATATIAAITLVWKASAHATVAGHAAAAGLILLGLPGLIFTLVLIAVAWARIAASAHTLLQVLVGVSIGAIFAGLFLL